MQRCRGAEVQMQRWSCRCRKTGVQRWRGGEVERWRDAEVLIVADVQQIFDCAGDCVGTEQVQRSRGGGVGAEAQLR